jgi:hypothetical protein
MELIHFFFFFIISAFFDEWIFFLGFNVYQKSIIFKRKKEKKKKIKIKK